MFPRVLRWLGFTFRNTPGLSTSPQECIRCARINSASASGIASAQATKQQATKNPDMNAVISLIAGGIRKIDKLDVQHTPDPDNRAHSEVVLPINEQDLTEVRVLLLRLAIVVIPLAGQQS